MRPRSSRSSRLRGLRRPQIALLLLVAVLVVGYTTNAVRDRGSAQSVRAGQPTPAASRSVSAGVALSSLPPQATDTVRLIQRGGPFPYAQDGAVFANNERRLSLRSRGYYHEYTVRTPGSPDRGARRIITGGSGEFYYTTDHYESFQRVDVNR